MFEKKQKFSYTEQRTENIKKLIVLLGISVFFLVHLVLTTFIITTREIRNTAMMPGIAPGERVVFLSFGIRELFPNFPLTKHLPVRRGDVVLVNIKGKTKHNILVFFADKLCRFATLGRFSFIKKDERLFLKRVIALPGDEVSMTNFVMRVKPADDMYTYTEFELSKDLYTPNIPEVPALWDKAVPFSGTMDTIVLGQDAYYVISDDRTNTNDSRTWGQIQAKTIAAKALFRYWPVTKFGRI